MPVLGILELETLVSNKLMSAGANRHMAESTAKALVLAEAQGIPSHGISRVSQYCDHLNNGRVNKEAIAKVKFQNHAAVLIDADFGLAFSACELAITEGVARAKEFGISIAAVTNSHHAGVLVDHFRPLKKVGMVGIGFSNVPAVMPVANGNHAILGTNPIAAFFPRKNNQPLLIDLSLSEIARGKLVIAKNKKQEIPLGWALDKDGNPTNDPQAAMDGLMLPIGSLTSAKGAMLALMVEIMASALIGANFGFEASTFFEAEGNVPKIGQTFIIINPNSISANSLYFDRLEVLIKEMLLDDGVRLPGDRRYAQLINSQSEGISLSDDIMNYLKA